MPMIASDARIEAVDPFLRESGRWVSQNRVSTACTSAPRRSRRASRGRGRKRHHTTRFRPALAPLDTMRGRASALKKSAKNQPKGLEHGYLLSVEVGWATDGYPNDRSYLESCLSPSPPKATWLHGLKARPLTSCGTALESHQTSRRRHFRPYRIANAREKFSVRHQCGGRGRHPRSVRSATQSGQLLVIAILLALIVGAVISPCVHRLHSSKYPSFDQVVFNVTCCAAFQCATLAPGEVVRLSFRPSKLLPGASFLLVRASHPIMRTRIPRAMLEAATKNRHDVAQTSWAEFGSLIIELRRSFRALEGLEYGLADPVPDDSARRTPRPIVRVELRP